MYTKYVNKWFKLETSLIYFPDEIDGPLFKVRIDPENKKNYFSTIDNFDLQNKERMAILLPGSSASVHEIAIQNFRSQWYLKEILRLYLDSLTFFNQKTDRAILVKRTYTKACFVIVNEKLWTHWNYLSRRYNLTKCRSYLDWMLLPVLPNATASFSFHCYTLYRTAAFQGYSLPINSFLTTSNPATAIPEELFFEKIFTSKKIPILKKPVSIFRTIHQFIEKHVIHFFYGVVFITTLDYACLFLNRHFFSPTQQPSEPSIIKVLTALEQLAALHSIEVQKLIYKDKLVTLKMHATTTALEKCISEFKKTWKSVNSASYYDETTQTTFFVLSFSP